MAHVAEWLARSISRVELPDLAVLDRFARAALSPIKVPRKYVFRLSLGRTETGKLRKHILKKSLMSE